jgi:hypothetical protein
MIMSEVMNYINVCHALTLPVSLPAGILPAQQHSRWAGEQAVGLRDCESDSEDEVEVHLLVPLVSVEMRRVRAELEDMHDVIIVWTDRATA